MLCFGCDGCGGWENMSRTMAWEVDEAYLRLALPPETGNLAGFFQRYGILFLYLLDLPDLGCEIMIR
jgi:hypothetical protein